MRQPEGFADPAEFETRRAIDTPPTDMASTVHSKHGRVRRKGVGKLPLDEQGRSALGLDETSRVFLINTEGVIDAGRYTELVDLRPDEVETRPEGATA